MRHMHGRAYPCLPTGSQEDGPPGLPGSRELKFACLSLGDW